MNVVWKQGPPTNEEWIAIEAAAASGDLFFRQAPDRATAHWHTNPDAFRYDPDSGEAPQSAYQLHAHDFPASGHSHGGWR